MKTEKWRTAFLKSLSLFFWFISKKNIKIYNKISLDLQAWKSLLSCSDVKVTLYTLGPNCRGRKGGSLKKTKKKHVIYLR